MLLERHASLGSFRRNGKSPFQPGHITVVVGDLNGQLATIQHADRGLEAHLPNTGFDLPKVRRQFAAGLPVKVFGARETTHNQLNANLGRPNDPSTKDLYKFLGPLTGANR